MSVNCNGICCIHRYLCNVVLVSEYVIGLYLRRERILWLHNRKKRNIKIMWNKTHLKQMFRFKWEKRLLWGDSYAVWDN